MKWFGLAFFGTAMVLVSAQPAAPASGVYMKGHALYEMCIENDNTLACTAYVAGVMDFLSAAGKTDILNEQFQPVCVPQSGVTLGQLQDIVIKYLREHPEERHEPGVFLVVGAIREAFPCPVAD